MSVREEKKRVVEELREKFSTSKSAVLTDFRGLNVAAMTELRKRMREAGVEYKVVKNTLTRIAVGELDLSELDEHLEGPTAVAFGYDDPVTPAKIISDFSKEHENNLPKIKAGVLNGKVISMEEVKALADLPPREVLLGQVLAGMQAPIAGLVNVLQGTIRGLVYALNAIKEQKEA